MEMIIFLIHMDLNLHLLTNQKSRDLVVITALKISTDFVINMNDVLNKVRC